MKNSSLTICCESVFLRQSVIKDERVTHVILRLEKLKSQNQLAIECWEDEHGQKTEDR